MNVINKISNGLRSDNVVLSYLKQMSVRAFSIAGKYPAVRLISILENPRYLIHLLKKNILYKWEKIDYAQKYKGISILSGQETLELMIKDRKSFGRFGDGEFDVILGSGIYPPNSDWSQRYSDKLKRDLEITLSFTHPNFLIGVCPPESTTYIDMMRTLWRYFKKEISYGHSLLFIPRHCPDVDISMLKNYFKTKDIIVATGEVCKISHFKIGRKSFFIECGNSNAYEKKDLIKSWIKNKIHEEELVVKDVLVLIGLGATSPIIAKEMLADNIQVWDTGHFFNFYRP